MISFVLYYVFFALIHLDILSLCFIAAGALLLFTKRHALGRVIIVLFLSIFALVNMSPLGPWMLIKLENMVARPSLPPEQDIAGIIMLGGSFSLQETQERGEPVYNLAAPRLLEYAELAHYYPHTKVILTGNALEGKYGERVLKNLGIAKKRMLVEDQSRCTEDHPRLLAALLDKTKTYLLVTSAFHMPRSILLFKGAGYNVIPYPVDYHTSGHFSVGSWVSYTLQRLSPIAFKQACIEWAGMTTYYIKGLTRVWYPKG
jgi:uncharacterized SAM-binding protein YcdF (DUF218 family)